MITPGASAGTHEVIHPVPPRSHRIQEKNNQMEMEVVAIPPKWWESRTWTDQFAAQAEGDSAEDILLAAAAAAEDANPPEPLRRRQARFDAAAWLRRGLRLLIAHGLVHLHAR